VTVRTIRRKYFNYFVFNIVDYGVNCDLLRSGTRHRALAQNIGNARGLDINSPLSVETSYVNISNATIPTMLGGSTTTSPPIVIMILRQQLDYVIVDYAAPTTPHPMKAKFSSSIIIYFSPHPTLGGSAMKNYLAYH
jgi:hypothetical protein